MPPPDCQRKIFVARRFFLCDGSLMPNDIASYLDRLRSDLRRLELPAADLARASGLSVPVCAEALGDKHWQPTTRVVALLETVLFARKPARQPKRRRAA